MTRAEAVAQAVDLRGLAQGVALRERRAAVNAAMAQLECGKSAAWAVVVGWRVLDYWTPCRPAPWSVSMAGTMP